MLSLFLGGAVSNEWKMNVYDRDSAMGEFVTYMMHGWVRSQTISGFPWAENAVTSKQRLLVNEWLAVIASECMNSDMIFSWAFENAVGVVALPSRYETLNKKQCQPRCSHGRKKQSPTAQGWCTVASWKLYMDGQDSHAIRIVRFSCYVGSQASCYMLCG